MIRELSLSYDEWGKLVYEDAHGQRHVGVSPVRGFPISDPDRFIALCSAEGRELLQIDDLDTLSSSTRAILDKALATREFIPIVTKVIRISGQSEPCEWDIVTDRGPTRFVLRNEDDILRLGQNRVLILDGKGIRYLIPEIDQLDAPSRRLMDRYL